jgi:hypothetical protein
LPLEFQALMRFLWTLSMLRLTPCGRVTVLVGTRTSIRKVTVLCVDGLRSGFQAVGFR